MLQVVYPNPEPDAKPLSVVESVERRRRQAAIASTQALLVSICQQGAELARQEAAALRRLEELEALEAFDAQATEVCQDIDDTNPPY